MYFQTRVPLWPTWRDILRRTFRISVLNNRYPSLHGIRVLIAFIIIGYHIKPWPNPRLEHIWFGMDVLFVMSGFLIGHLLLYSFDHEGGMLRFYIRRSFRTFPLYYVVLTIATVSVPFALEARPLVWREFVWLTNFYELGRGPYIMFWGWSLAVEEHFYLFCPLIILGLRKLRRHRDRLTGIGAVCLIVLAWRMAVVYGATPVGFNDAIQRVYYNTQFRMDELLIGIMAGYLTYHFPDRVREFFNRPAMRLFSPLAIMACFTGCYLLPKGHFAFGFTIAGFGYFFLILYSINVASALSRFLSHRAFLYMASLTYGLYLVHIYVLRFIDQHFAAFFDRVTHHHVGSIWTLKVLATFSLSIVVAYVAHLVVEKPMLLLRDRFAS